MRKLATFHNKSNIIFTQIHIPSGLFVDDNSSEKILQNTLYKMLYVSKAQRYPKCAKLFKPLYLHS